MLRPMMLAATAMWTWAMFEVGQAIAGVLLAGFVVYWTRSVLGVIRGAR